VSALPGWHPQPDGRERYWDGEAWTTQFREVTVVPVVPDTQGAGGASFEFMAVKTIRGREAKKIAEQQNLGWELVGQTQGTLKTTLNFRRRKPVTVFSKAWTSFRALNPKARLGLVAAAVVILLFPIIAGIASSVGGGDATPNAEPSKSPAPTAAENSEEPATSSVPTPSASPAETYTYEGPPYEIVTVDENVSSADLDQYWVYTSKFDYSKDDFRDQVKMIITDIARREETPELIVQVVSDKEIIEAESDATIADFMEEHDLAYFKNVMGPKEAAHWVAWYQGGWDPDTAQPSDSAAAFEITWLAEKIQGVEKWKPQT
jgi:hypothetical protein